jgi:hypothetical protein
MNTERTLRQLIREELQNVLNEQTGKEPRARAPRPSVGKKKGRGGARFTSAGTIPPTSGTKMQSGQVRNREEIGKKMLNLHRRGGEVGKKFRAKINGQLEKKGLPTSKKHQYSQIWANASGMAVNGATADDVKQPSVKSTKSSKNSK